jgi:serine/threonine protein kinase
MKKALVVGINQYPTAPLSGCVNDAIAVAEVLRSKQYGYNVVQFLDERATRVAVRRAIAELFTDAEEAIFYFAGHGARTEVATVLCTADGVEYDEGVDVDFIRRVVDAKSAQAKVALLILDCCHSGGGSPRNSGARLTPRDLTDALSLKAEGRVLIASCGAEQLSYETADGRHGSFTSQLLEGLKGAAADRNGTITIHTLYEFLSQRFELNAQQTPAFRGDTSGRIILATGFVAGPASGTPPPVESVALLVDEAKQHMLRYHEATARSMSDWQSSGFREACDRLAPVLDWFERKTAKLPALLSSKDFLQQRDHAYSRLQHLATIDVGTETKWGRIEEYLGGGTFGSVYRLKQSNGQQAVIKVYHPHDLRLGEKRARFRRGYDAMKQLDHPHIVQVGEFSNCPVAFMMDYIEGPNLRNFQGVTREPEDLLRILLLVAETLRHAHARQVVHRDVKPENIVVGWSQENGWTPYLTDFDLAWFSTATQVTKEAMGTVFYAAPEQLAKPMSSVAHAPTTDIFSFGQLMYFVLTGSDPVPLGAADNRRALSERLEAQAGYTERAATVLVQLYNACTEEDPEDRIPSFQRICDKLFKTQRFLGGKDVNARMPIEQFLTELRFAIVGLSPAAVSHESFVTVSRRVRISLAPESIADGRWKLDVHFAYEQGAVMQGVANQTMRSTLNSRIENALREFDEAKRRTGQYSTFETYVEIAKILPTFAYVARCRKIIGRVVDVLEQV